MDPQLFSLTDKIEVMTVSKATFLFGLAVISISKHHLQDKQLEKMPDF